MLLRREKAPAPDPRQDFCTSRKVIESIVELSRHYYRKGRLHPYLTSPGHGGIIVDNPRDPSGYLRLYARPDEGNDVRRSVVGPNTPWLITTFDHRTLGKETVRGQMVSHQGREIMRVTRLLPDGQTESGTVHQSPITERHERQAVAATIHQTRLLEGVAQVFGTDTDDFARRMTALFGPATAAGSLLRGAFGNASAYHLNLHSVQPPKYMANGEFVPCTQRLGELVPALLREQETVKRIGPDAVLYPPMPAETDGPRIPGPRAASDFLGPLAASASFAEFWAAAE